MSIVDRMPKFGDWILFNGVSFLFWEVLQDEWPSNYWMCELPEDSAVDVFDDRIRTWRSHDLFFKLPADDCHVCEPDERGAGI